MWTTSSSPGRTRFWLRLAVVAACGALVAAGLTACGWNQARVVRQQVAQEGPLAPDAPRERPDEEVEKPSPIDPGWLKPVELAGVELRRVDDGLAALAGEAFLKEATDPRAIVVYTQEPLDATPRTSSPVIVLNGVVLDNTWPFLEEGMMLVAFLPDAELIGDVNTFEVFWVGNEVLTRTREPLEITREELGLD